MLSSLTQAKSDTLDKLDTFEDDIGSTKSTQDSVSEQLVRNMSADFPCPRETRQLGKRRSRIAFPLPLFVP